MGCHEYVAAGYEAQLKSIVMLKNHGHTLPLKSGAKVWHPIRHVAAGVTHWQKEIKPYDEYPIGKQLLSKYFEVADSPEEADFAIVCIKSPIGHWGYVLPNEEYPEGHYQPISLQYSTYTADCARERALPGTRMSPYPTARTKGSQKRLQMREICVWCWKPKPR